MQYVDQVVTMLINTDAHKATKYVSDKHVVRACRRLEHGQIPKRPSRLDIMLTIGRPNYAERKFIAQCRKAKVSLPVRKIQLKFPPRRA